MIVSEHNPALKAEGFIDVLRRSGLADSDALFTHWQPN